MPRAAYPSTCGPSGRWRPTSPTVRSTSSRSRRRGTASANTRGSRSPDWGTPSRPGQWSIYWRDRHLRFHEYERKRPRPRTSGRCSTWSCGGPESGPPTYPQQRRRRTSSASSSRPVAGPSRSTVLLRILRCQPSQPTGIRTRQRSETTRPTTQRPALSGLDSSGPVHFSSTFSYSEHALIVNRGGDGRDVGALRGVP